jgi:hypothetical protein
MGLNKQHNGQPRIKEFLNRPTKGRIANSGFAKAGQTEVIQHLCLTSADGFQSPASLSRKLLAVIVRHLNSLSTRN